MMRLELVHGEQRGIDGRRCHGIEKGRGDRLIDRDATDIETIHPAAADDVFAGAMVRRRRVPAVIVRAQPPTTMTADGEPLQQRRAFSHGAAGLMRLGVDVRIDAHLIGLERHPINKAGMMIA